MKNRWSTKVLVVSALITLAVGFFLAVTLKFGSGSRATAATVKAVINRNSTDNVCQQYAGSDFGHVVKYAYPTLRQGDKIVWHGQVDLQPGNVPVVIEFDPNLSPFSSNKFKEDQQTPAVGNLVAPRDYPFLKVTVDGTACSAFSDPGVHVDQ